MRHLRFIPHQGALVEISCRTFQGRKLLRPTRKLRRIAIGILARALKQQPLVQLHAVVFLSNHYHLLLSVPDAQAMARFMTYCNGLFARKLAPLVGWKGPLWAKRYDAVLVSDEEASQVARLRYLLAQGVKEGLVLTPQDWPGLHCAPALVRGGKLRGCWVNGTRASRDRHRGKRRPAADYEEPAELQLSPLPCWAHLNWEQIAQQVQALMETILSPLPAEEQKVLGPRRLLQGNPHRPTPSPQRGPAPWCHTASRAARDALVEARRLFTLAYREASRLWCQGNVNAPFPPGALRPPGPWVPAEVST